MRISRVAAFSIILLVSVCLVFAVSCGGSGGSSGAATGVLPVLKTGDTWTQKVTTGGAQYTFVTSVTGEEVFQGIDCYVVEASITPPLDGASKLYAKIDKSTLDAVTNDGAGQLSGTSFTLNITMLHKYSVQPYPLSVGKTWVDTKNSTSTATAMGKTQTQTETNVYTYEVEKTETITVAAGTFNCFKIVKYNDNHSVLDTRWVADATKCFEVREIDNESDMEYELTSYSVSK